MKMNNAIIIQHCNNPSVCVCFADMMRLTFQRHAAYAWSHNMDFQVYFGSYTNRGVTTGAWNKIKMIQDCLERGYEYVFWIDSDAAIMDFNADLRDAFIDGFIGCCEHNANGIPKHLNVGVTFVRNSELSKEFIQDWWDSFPGDKQWLEQGSFNELMKLDKYKGLVFKMDDKYNATVNVNMIEKPVIVGWHGVNPESERFSQMKQALYNDHIKFRV